MSADGIDQCPRCIENQATEVCRLENAVNDAYGILEIEQFDELRGRLDVARNRLAKMQDPYEQENGTFREYYEIYGASSGTIIVSYWASCTICGLQTSFKYNHPFHPRLRTDAV